MVLFVLQINAVCSSYLQGQGISSVRVIGDGNGHFMAGMDMLVELGSPVDPFAVSDADTMLAFINAEAKAPEPVALISRVGCPHYQGAKDFLIDRKIRFNSMRSLLVRILIKWHCVVCLAPQAYPRSSSVGCADELSEPLLKVG